MGVNRRLIREALAARCAHLDLTVYDVVPVNPQYPAMCVASVREAVGDFAQVPSEEVIIRLLDGPDLEEAQRRLDLLTSDDVQGSVTDALSVRPNPAGEPWSSIRIVSVDNQQFLPVADHVACGVDLLIQVVDTRCP